MEQIVEQIVEGNVELTGTYHRRPSADIGADTAWYGTMDLELGPLDDETFLAGSQLAVWSQVVLSPGPGTNARVTERLTGHVVLAPIDVVPIAEERRWRLDGLRCRYPARHANDGPEAAYVIRPDGTTITVAVHPVVTSHVDDRDAGPTPERPTGSLPREDLPALVPMPRHVDVADRATSAPARLSTNSPLGAPVVALADRLGVDVFAADGAAEVPDDGETVDVDVRLDSTLATPGRYTVACRDGRCEIIAADDSAARHGLVTLAQLAAGGGPLDGTEIDDAPAMVFRGVHLDLARRWYEPDVVGRLIDLAAWRKLSHVHLHLTDDEAWRFPVPEYPTLATIGGTRGHGLPVPPVCASGAGPYGRAYTADEIGAWVARADALGVVLVPEVDVPGHCFAALAAVPALRDPDDTSGAISVQGFTDNVLVPGHPQTEPFLRAVFGALAALFPSSPVIHIGGDEVPAGAWQGSPLAHAYARDRGLTTTAEIEAQFHRELIAMIRDTTGRDVAAWEEVGLSGVEPGAYAVAWTSAAAGQRLASAGHRVVMAPGQAYYLDMAFDRAFESPGAVWAGTVPLPTTCAFDPHIDGGEDLPGELIGVQACIWGEHISSIAVLDQLVFPRLDAIAERGWRGDVAGGPASLARRASGLPRFATASE